MNQLTLVPKLNNRLQQTAVDELTSTKKSTTMGYGVVAAFFVTFIAWAAAAPMSTAAIAQGTVGVSGQNKKVQHLQGGIVQEIFVKEGDRVAKGQILLALNKVAAESLHENINVELLHAETEHARWKAEYEGSSNVSFVYDSANNFPMDALAYAQQTQENLFMARAENTRQTAANIKKRIAQENDEQRAATSRLRTLKNKFALIAKEYREYQVFESEGLVTRNQLFSLRQDAANIKLDIEDTSSRLKLARNKIKVLEGEKAELFKQKKQEAAENMSRLQNFIDSRKPELSRLTHTLSLQEVASPIDGQVINLGVNAVGAVVAPGEIIMEVVPVGEKLLIVSKVSPQDRDSVAVGQPAEVRFSAFDRRSSSPIQGEVTVISADSIVDLETQTSYYKTTVQLEFSDTDTISPSDIYPGMQAEVLIVTGKQTMMQYLLKPVSQSFNRALRED